MIHTASQKFMLHVYYNVTEWYTFSYFYTFFSLEWSKYSVNSFMLLIGMFLVCWILGITLQNKIARRESIKHSSRLFSLKLFFSSLSLSAGYSFPILEQFTLIILLYSQVHRNVPIKTSPFNQDPILEGFYCTMIYTTDENNEQKACYETSSV
jgi:hypothetical protein